MNGIKIIIQKNNMKWSLRIMKTVYKLILVIMVLVLFVSCTGKEKDNSNLEIKSEEQVQEVVNNVSEKISDVSSELKSIDKALSS